MSRWRHWLGGRRARLRQQARWVLAQGGYCSQPDFLIIGAQKCGTVALFNYLANHPLIRPGMKKEVSFFNKDTHYERGHAWYHSHFPLPAPGLTFEGTPEYFYDPQCAERIHKYNPGMKLIVLLRNPVERAFSAWNMFRVLHRDRPEYLRARSRTANPAARAGIKKMISSDDFNTFADAARWEIEQSPIVDEEPEPSFIRRGLYAQQLKRFLERFPQEQILVLESKHLRFETAAALNNVTAFLDLPIFEWKNLTLAPLHEGRYDGGMLDPEIHQYLDKFYAPHNAELYTLIGKDFGW